MASNMKPTLRWLLEQGVVGETYEARGWVRTKRDSKTVSFLALNDGSTITNLQVVLPSELDGVAEALEPVGTGASVCVSGELVESPGKGQRVELVAKSIEVLGLADGETYPLQKKGHTFEFLRSIAHQFGQGFDCLWVRPSQSQHRLPRVAFLLLFRFRVKTDFGNTRNTSQSRLGTTSTIARESESLT